MHTFWGFKSTLALEIVFLNKNYSPIIAHYCSKAY